MRLAHRFVLPAAIALSLAACQPATAPEAEPVPTPAEELAPEAAPEVAVVAEAWLSAMIEADNIDSPAVWSAPDGAPWVIATAKATDALVVYHGDSGETLRRVGVRGSEPGQFLRPNGVFAIDDVLFVVERDGRRAQLLSLPDFAPLAVFGQPELVKPYGLWVRAQQGGYEVYITDSYELVEDEVPPLHELDRRVRHYRLARDGEAWTAALVGTYGDTGEAGALRVVESIWGDPAHDRLLIAEEDETWANEIKVYGLDGRFSGTVFGTAEMGAQAEGIALFACADGSGLWITTAQGKDRTVFHLFDRIDLAYRGAFAGQAVANTDGIWLHQAGNARFPAGALYAVHDDQGVVAFDWRDVAAATGLSAECP